MTDKRPARIAGTLLAYALAALTVALPVMIVVIIVRLFVWAVTGA